MFNADDNSKIKPKIWKDPSRKLSYEYTSINHFIKDYKYDYTETQIHGDLFTNDINYVLVPQEYLEEISSKVSDYNKKYIEDLINIGELPYNEVRPYMIKRYEQILANFNLAIGKQVYKNVKCNPDWINDLEGL